MKNGKYSNKGSKRTVTLLLALVLLLGCGIGGTLAYLTANTNAVTNTFVMGDIGTLTLTETDEDHQYLVVPGVDIVKDPKVTYTLERAKTAGYKQQDAYLFITIDADDEDNDNGWSYDEATKTYTVGTNLLSWSVNTEWSPLMNGNGEQVVHNGARVFYMEVAAATVDDVGKDTDATDDDDFIVKSIIAGDSITVSSAIAMKHLDPNQTNDYIMDEVDNIVFKAYAIQKPGFSETTEGGVTVTAVENAWKAVKD